MRMPEPDPAVIQRRSAIIAALEAMIPPASLDTTATAPGERVISTARELRAYETDGLTAYKQVPLAVVLASSTEEVRRVLKFCNEQRIKVVARGSGTSLSGGALPL